MFAQYLLVVCLLVQSHCDESYTNKYDGVDLDEILASDRLLNGYISCLLETGPCTADAKELKNGCEINSVCISRFHAQTTEPISMKFGTQVVYSLRKDIGYFLIEKKCCKGLKRGLKGCMEVLSSLLETGPCTADAKELKKNLPDAIENDCNKCNKRQREGADKIMHFIIDQRPSDWDKLEQKYNSDGSYKRKYLLRLHPEEQKNEAKTEKEEKSEE